MVVLDWYVGMLLSVRLCQGEHVGLLHAPCKFIRTNPADDPRAFFKQLAYIPARTPSRHNLWTAENKWSM